MTISQSPAEQLLEPEVPIFEAEQTVTEPSPVEGEPVEIELNIDHIVTEDDEPLDNLPSEKQQRLLTEPLYSSWSGPGPDRRFLAAANVGLFYAIKQRPLVPDVFLSLDVQVAEDWWSKAHRSYFLWEFGKAPEVVVEIVSNQVGGEDKVKLRRYAQIAIAYYVIFDPTEQLGGGVLRVYELELGTRTYKAMNQTWLAGVGLGLTLWEGAYEGKSGLWLRWCDQQGQVIPTGAERAEQERQRAEQEYQRAERLVAQLRALGIEPEA